MRKALAGLILIAASLLAADVSGTWNAKVETDAGGGTPVFVLKQSGEKLSGTYTGALGDAEVSGSVKGEDVVIQFDVQGREDHLYRKARRRRADHEGQSGPGGDGQRDFHRCQEVSGPLFTIVTVKLASSIRYSIR